MKTWIAIALFTNSIVAYAYEPERAISNLASELAECSAYYASLQYALERSQVDGAPAERNALYAFALAAEISSAEVTAARVELRTTAMGEEIGGDLSNFAILINKYGQRCKEILEDPEGRLTYWVDQ